MYTIVIEPDRRKADEFWMKRFGMDLSVKGRRKRLVQKRRVFRQITTEHRAGGKTESRRNL